MNPRNRLWILALAGGVLAACSDFTGAGPDPGRAGLSEGRRVALLASDLYANSIAVDDSRLYVLTGTDVESLAKNGTDGRTLAPFQQDGLLVAYGNRLFVRTSNGGIVGVPKTGGDVAMLVDSSQAQGSGPLAVDASGLYFGSGPNVMRASLDGSGLTTIANDGQQQGPQSALIALDASNVYYVAYLSTNGGSNQSALKSISKADGSTRVLATSNGQISAVCAAGGMVYFVDTGSNSTTGAVLDSVDPTDGTLATVDDALNAGNPGNALVACDDAAVYFAGGSGLLEIATGAGGAGTTLIVENTNPMALVIDDVWIYWTDQNANGWIFKIHK